MSKAIAISRRELVAYFSTPLAYVFIVIFLALAGATTFYFGGFFQRGQGTCSRSFRLQFSFFVSFLIFQRRKTNISIKKFGKK